MSDLRIITNSEIRCYRACPRRHYLSYDLCYRPITVVESLAFGALGHLGLGAWWHGLDPVDTVRGAVTDEQDPIQQIAVEETLTGYAARWYHQECLGVEVPFACDLVNPRTNAVSRTFRLAGKIDAIIPAGIVEHKFTSEDITPGSDYWRRLQIDGQISAYFLGAASLGHNPQVCLYDVIRRPRLRVSSVPIIEDGSKVVLDANGARVRTKDGKKWRETADIYQGYVLQTRPETPTEFRARLRVDIAANLDTYYRRGEVVRLESEEQEALWDCWTTARQIRDGQLSERHPRNPDSCNHWGRTCEYLDVCTGLASIDDPLRFRKAATAHEELAA
jgi:hypothetical protein